MTVTGQPATGSCGCTRGDPPAHGGRLTDAVARRTVFTPDDATAAVHQARHDFLSTDPEVLARTTPGRHQRLPEPAALLRRAGAVLVEAHDEWQTGDRRYRAEGSWPTSPRLRPTTTELLAA